MRLECDCGFMAEGVSDDDLVVAAQVHARVAHRMHLTAPQILAVAHENRGRDCAAGVVPAER